VAAGAILAGGRAEALGLGDAMPAATVKLLNVDGRELSLGQVAGKQGTPVIFSCNHCPWVRAWEDRMVAVGNEYAAKGFGVIAVNPNDPDKYPEDGFSQMQERARTVLSFRSSASWLARYWRSSSAEIIKCPF
jgi:hypothetical protein